MLRAGSGIVVVALGLTLAAGEAEALAFWSGDGGDLLLGSAVAGSITTVTPEGVWGDVSDDAGLAAGTARWISYADTGIGGITAPDTTDRFDPAAATAVFGRSFVIAPGGRLDLWVLGDDTARVELEGPGITVPLLQTVFAGQLDPCAPGGTGLAIGCLEADMGAYHLSGLLGGTYTLKIYAYQTNGSVFGAQYAGQFTPVLVPEPLSLATLGVGLLGVGALRRRSRAQAEAS